MKIFCFFVFLKEEGSRIAQERCGLRFLRAQAQSEENSLEQALWSRLGRNFLLQAANFPVDLATQVAM